MAGAGELAELQGEIVALETAPAAAFGEIAALRAAVTGGGAEVVGEAMDAMATDLEGSVLRGIVLAGRRARQGLPQASSAAWSASPTPRDRLPEQVGTTAVWKAALIGLWSCRAETGK